MKNVPLGYLVAGLAITLLSLLVLGCEDQSENIPVQWDEISELMATGWAEYEAGNYLEAKASFEAAGQRNAQYLPAYNGLGWCAVRLTNFDDAEEQFSFITTLANPESEASLLADAYAGLSLSAAIERSSLEITEGGDQVALDALAQQSFDRANLVFDLLGENYSPSDHDTGFGSEGMHLLCAQNYFYLQEYEHAEAQLNIVDPDFIPGLIEQFCATWTADSLFPQSEVVGSDTIWFLLAEDNTGAITSPGFHQVSQVSLVDTTDTTVVIVGYQLEYHWASQNRLILEAAEGKAPKASTPFTASYVYYDDFINYLYGLIEHIEELIEF